MKRVQELHAYGGATLRLVAYAPETVQQVHSHDCPSLALLLWGRVRETTARSDVTAGAGSVSVKFADSLHSDRYGPESVGLLSIKVDDPTLWSAVVGEVTASWRTLPLKHHRSLLSTLLKSDAKETRDEALFELLALSMPRHLTRGKPPMWLRRVHQHLTESPSTVKLGDLAAELGVHRVYLSRAFVQWFGEPPSIYRRRRMMDLALRSALYQRTPFAAVAADTGFADQSHLARTVQQQTGNTLNSLRRLVS
jgi:AraC family transcriptional regulator